MYTLEAPKPQVIATEFKIQFLERLKKVQPRLFEWADLSKVMSTELDVSSSTYDLMVHIIESKRARKSREVASLGVPSYRNEELPKVSNQFSSN